MAMRHSGTNGFTLIEAVIALAVASIALLALLRLQLVAMSTADKAQGITQAVLVAQGKMAEALRGNYPSVGTTAGTVETSGDQFTWQMEVTDIRLPQLVTADGATPSYRPSSGRPGLRKLAVEVTWQKGPGDKQVSLTTYLAENGLREGQDKTTSSR
jgi:general secretion pathway protein I